MNSDHFRTLYEHGFWARDRILAAMDGLSDADYERPNNFTYGSIGGILAHTMQSETRWLRRWRRQEPPPPAPEPAGVRELAEQWQSQESEMRSFLAELKDADLETEFVTKGRDGSEFRLQFWAYLSQVANHGIQHRSEAAEALTMIGRSPGDLDLIFFLREQAQG